jgi:hypothetical protein
MATSTKPDKYARIYALLHNPRKSIIQGGTVTQAHRSDCPLCARPRSPLKTCELVDGGVLVKCQACGGGMFEFAAHHGLNPMDFAPDSLTTTRQTGAHVPPPTIAHRTGPTNWSSLFDACDELDYLLAEIGDDAKTGRADPFKIRDAQDLLAQARLQARLAMKNFYHTTKKAA